MIAAWGACNSGHPSSKTQATFRSPGLLPPHHRHHDFVPLWECAPSAPIHRLLDVILFQEPAGCRGSCQLVGEGGRVEEKKSCGFRGWLSVPESAGCFRTQSSIEQIEKASRKGRAKYVYGAIGLHLIHEKEMFSYICLRSPKSRRELRVRISRHTQQQLVGEGGRVEEKKKLWVQGLVGCSVPESAGCFRHSRRKSIPWIRTTSL